MLSACFTFLLKVFFATTEEVLSAPAAVLVVVAVA
jgi:hypothetical protein